MEQKYDEKEFAEKLKRKYKKRKEIYIGVFFLILSVIFSIIAFTTKEYDVFYGVLLQIMAGVMLIFNNMN